MLLSPITDYGGSGQVEVDCKLCQSRNMRTFNGEVALQSPGIKGLGMPIVWVFQQVQVCLDCGQAEFEIPEKELRLLAQGTPPLASGGADSIA